MRNSFVYKQLPSNKLAIGKHNLHGGYKPFYGAYRIFYKVGYCSSTNQITVCVTSRIYYYLGSSCHKYILWLVQLKINVARSEKSQHICCLYHIYVKEPFNYMCNCCHHLRRVNGSYQGQISLHFDLFSLYSCRTWSLMLWALTRIPYLDTARFIELLYVRSPF